MRFGEARASAIERNERTNYQIRFARTQYFAGIAVDLDLNAVTSAKDPIRPHLIVNTPKLGQHQNANYGE
jgi:hypothetical protein